MRAVRLLAAAAAAILAAGMQAQVAITDGDFNDWSFSSFQTGADSASVVREAAGGNPGARLNVTTMTILSSAGGTAIKNDFSTNAVLEGAAFTMTFDVLSGSGAFGQGQGISLLVEQGGTVYAMGLGITGFPRNWDPVEFNGVLNAASFGRLIGAGPLTPTFDGSVATRFGFAASNTTSGTLTQYYDNFELNVEAVVAPAPVLAITKAGSEEEVELGQSFIYTITVQNTGNGSATGVTVTDDLPDGVALLNATPSQGTCSGTSTVACSLGTLAAAASATVTLSVSATGAGETDNVAVVDSNETTPLSTPLGAAGVTITPATAPIPTASDWALMMLGALLALAGVLAVRLR